MLRAIGGLGRFGSRVLFNPPQNEATYSIARSTTGGNPGAYMRLSYDLSSKWGVRILLNALAAVYDPAVQGAIYTIDFTEDCIGAAD